MVLLIKHVHWEQVSQHLENSELIFDADGLMICKGAVHSLTWIIIKFWNGVRLLHLTEAA